MANFFIKIVRVMINAINKIPGVNIDKPKKVSFDRIEEIGEIGNVSDTDTGNGGGGGTAVYGGSTTVRQPPDIYIYQYFNGPVVGPSGMQGVGEYVVGAIQAYAGAGGDVTWEET